METGVELLRSLKSFAKKQDGDALQNILIDCNFTLLDAG